MKNNEVFQERKIEELAKYYNTTVKDLVDETSFSLYFSTVIYLVLLVCLFVLISSGLSISKLGSFWTPFGLILTIGSIVYGFVFINMSFEHVKRSIFDNRSYTLDTLEKEYDEIFKLK